MSRIEVLQTVLSALQIAAVLALCGAWLMTEWRGSLHTTLTWSVVAISLVQVAIALGRGAKP